MRPVVGALQTQFVDSVPEDPGALSGPRRPLHLVLQDDGAGRHLVPMAYTPDPERDRVATAQLSVDAQVAEREFAHPALHLESDAQRPDVLQLERRLLPNHHPVVPRLALSDTTCNSHDGLPPS